MSKQTRKTKMLNFTKKDFEIHEYLMTVDNASEYVIDLIKRDLENKKESEVAKCIEESYQKILVELADIKKILLKGDFKSDTKKISNEIKNVMSAALLALEDEDE
ncbi:Uncharacterised protein [Turicibacter sanguinis]|nr:Uncharacterised protein [Turicibacter sanguinis]